MQRDARSHRVFAPHSLGLDAWSAWRRLREEDGAGRNDPDWRWIREYGVEGEKRAIEVAANLFNESLDVRRLARYLRHHPSPWRELSSRLERRLPGERLERAIERLHRLGYLYGEGAQVR